MSAALHPGSIEVSQQSDAVVVAVRGVLDADVAELVYEAVVSAIRSGIASEIEVDLRGMDEWTPEGLAGLGASAALGIRFRMGPYAASST
jgi:hypothetical protein